MIDGGMKPKERKLIEPSYGAIRMSTYDVNPGVVAVSIDPRHRPILSAVERLPAQCTSSNYAGNQQI